MLGPTYLDVGMVEADKRANAVHIARAVTQMAGARRGADAAGKFVCGSPTDNRPAQKAATHDDSRQSKHEPTRLLRGIQGVD
jgi:hypothetical protein